jgi:HlyD family secretion protein
LSLPVDDFTVINVSAPDASISSPGSSPPTLEVAHEAGAALPLLVVDPSNRPRRDEARAALSTGATRIGAVLLLGGAIWVAHQRSTDAATAASLAAASSEIPPPGARERKRVVGLGTILPVSGVRTIAVPFGAGDARIAALRVAEGQRVEQGAVLAVLDNEPVLAAAIASASAQVAYRKAALAQVTSSVRASRAELSAQLAGASAGLSAAERELGRADTLLRGGSLPAQDVDQRRTARDQSRHEVDRLRAALSRYTTAGGAGQVDVSLARRNVEVAEAELSRATADLERAFVRAPIAGTILVILSDPGERPHAEGILTMGDLDRMKVEVDVYETQIGQIAIGDRAKVHAAPLPTELRGAVSRIGLEVGRQTTMDASPAANTDARVVKVTVALDEASSRAARGLTSLQVTAELAVKGDP